MSQIDPPQEPTNLLQPNSTHKHSYDNTTEPQGQLNSIQNQTPSISVVEKTSYRKLEAAPETTAENDNVETKPEEEPMKSIEKPSKRQSLKSKQSAKTSQRKKQMEKDQINSAAMKTIGASGRTLKEGHNQIQSNVREYSAEEQRQELPTIEPKRVNTESKRSKPLHSDNKSKTEGKEVREEKVALVTSGKRSKRKSGQEVPIPENINEEKEEVDHERNTRSKSKRKREQQKQEKEQVLNSKKRLRKSEDLDRDQAHEKEESHPNINKSNVKSAKKVRESPAKGASHVKSKHSKSALKSAARSGVKKVKIDHSAASKR